MSMKLPKGEAKGFTIPKRKVIVPETSDNYYSTYVASAGDWPLPIIDSGDKCIVIVDNIEYRCTVYNYTDPWGGMYIAIGDSRRDIDENDNPVMTHPEDVPFLIEYNVNNDGGGYHFFHDYYLQYSGNTIEVQKLIPTPVKQIADASGRVIWSSGPSMATVTITGRIPRDQQYDNYVSVTINGNTYQIDDASMSSGSNSKFTIETLEVPIGTVIELSATEKTINGLYGKSYNGGKIFINDKQIGVAGGTKTHSYTVNSSVEIYLDEYTYGLGNGGDIYVIETPINFNMNGVTYSTLPSMTWKDWNYSTYNTSGQVVRTIKNSSGDDISINDIIIQGEKYTCTLNPHKQCTVTLRCTGMSSNATSRITYNETTYGGNVATVKMNGGDLITLNVTEGEKIYCEVNSPSQKGNVIYISDIAISNDNYTYVISNNTSIDLYAYAFVSTVAGSNAAYGMSTIKITEIGDTAAIIPQMTSNTAPYGQAQCWDGYNSGQEYRAYMAFDGNVDTLGDVWYGLSYGLTTKIGYVFPAVQKNIKKITLYGGCDQGGTLTSGVVEYTTDGSTWSTLFNLNESNFQPNKENIYYVNIANLQGIRVGAKTSSNGMGLIMKEIQVYISSEDMRKITIPAAYNNNFNPNHDAAYIEFNGNKYVPKATPQSFNVPAGTVVTCTVKAISANQNITPMAYIYLNNQIVAYIEASGGTTATKTYNYTIEKDTLFKILSTIQNGTIYITDQ